MTEFTTIQISKDLKTKLDLMKGENNESYNNLIKNLLEQAGGTFVEDVITIQREKVAFTLKYWNDDEQKITDVTYGDLASSKVGDIFVASENPSGDKWVNSGARIVAREDGDLILFVEEISFDDGKFSSVKSVVHVNVF